jgi:hypothetical protein
MLVDYERCWLALKREIVAKKSHGQRDLLTAMAQIEVESELDEPGFDPGPMPHKNGNGATVGASREGA